MRTVAVTRIGPRAEPNSWYSCRELKSLFFRVSAATTWMIEMAAMSTMNMATMTTQVLRMAWFMRSHLPVRR